MNAVDRSSAPRAVFLAVNASYAHTSLAAWRLRQTAAAAGWHWTTFELSDRDPTQRVLSRLHALRPALVLASFYLFNRRYLLHVLGRYKRLDRACVILGGGPEFLGDNRDFLGRYGFVDAVLRGEGEQALGDFLAHFNRPANRANIPGICMLRAGRYIDNGMAQPPDLAALPSPLPALMDGFRKPFVLYETSRGCAGGCVFCTSGTDGRARFFPLENVRRDLRILADAGVPEIRLADRTFNESLEHALNLLRIFRQEFPRLRFHLEIDPGRLAPALIDELARANPGQLYLEVGIQTLDQRVFANLRRHGNAALAAQGLKTLCRLTNLHVHADLIAGLPGGTLAGLTSDLNTLIALGPEVIQLEILKVLPGTPLARQCAPWGMTAAPDPPYEVLATPDMTVSEFENARGLSCLTDWFYNQPDLQPVTRKAAALVDDFWPRLLEICAPRLAISGAPSLENRFKLMDKLLAGIDFAKKMQRRLRYARLKHSFTNAYGVQARPFKGPVPPGARLLEGDGAQGFAQAFLVEDSPRLLFVYGRRSRRAMAVYALPGNTRTW